MSFQSTTTTQNLPVPLVEADNDNIARLIGQLYDVAPAHERCQILEYLIHPLGVLSLVAVANGVFAKYWLRNIYESTPLRFEDITNIHSNDVISLAQHAQQVSFDAVHNLTRLLTKSSALASISATGLLLAVLLPQTHGPTIEDD